MIGLCSLTIVQANRSLVTAGKTFRYWFVATGRWLWPSFRLTASAAGQRSNMNATMHALSLIHSEASNNRSSWLRLLSCQIWVSMNQFFSAFHRPVAGFLLLRWAVAGL